MVSKSLRRRLLRLALSGDTVGLSDGLKKIIRDGGGGVGGGGGEAQQVAANLLHACAAAATSTTCADDDDDASTSPLATIRWLLTCGGQEEELRSVPVDTRDASNGYKTPLQQAANHGNIHAAGVLLDAGADVNAHKSNGWTALHYAAAGNHADLCQLLIVRGAVVSGERGATRDGESALFVAAREGSAEACRVLLSGQRGGSDPNEATHRGRTALHACVKHAGVSALAMAQRLLSCGARTSVADRSGMTPWHEASASCGGAEMLRLMVEHESGGDGSLRATELRESLTAPGRRHSLHFAAEAGRLDVLRFLLEEADLVPDVDIPTSDDSTALYFAASEGHDSCVQFLLERGADCKKGNRHRSSLHVATGFGFVGIVSRLLAAGADPELLDDSGRKPCEVAAHVRSAEDAEAIVRLLRLGAGGNDHPSSSSSVDK